MGGWNSAEYQRSDHNRNEDKGRSAGEGMEAKGETMKEYWTVRRRGGSDSERAGDKRLALSALWRMRFEQSSTEFILVHHRTVTREEMQKRSETQARRIANALINYTIDNSATQGSIQYIATNAILDFAQEIMDGKR